MRKIPLDLPEGMIALYTHHKLPDSVSTKSSTQSTGQKPASAPIMETRHQRAPFQALHRAAPPIVYRRGLTNDDESTFPNLQAHELTRARLFGRQSKHALYPGSSVPRFQLNLSQTHQQGNSRNSHSQMTMTFQPQHRNRFNKGSTLLFRAYAPSRDCDLFSHCLLD